MVDRRRSDDYRQFSAHIPKDLYRKFKKMLVDKEINISEAVEDALKIWIQIEEDKEDKQ
jgi:metal-responsive CopG/Arc/MetJ family transcriptional regulator